MDYNAKSIEHKWSEFWTNTNTHALNNNQNAPHYYVLEMFPYPSGKLHMGHVRNYALGDTLARFKRMNGFNVMYPMGFDSFGLPAENAAIQRNIDPDQWTLSNIDTMKEQLVQLGLSYNWESEIATSKETYYKWNQWIFIKMYEKGLVYRKKGVVNWDPVDHTVLANEQVIDGKGWRSGAPVEQKEIEQWYLKITDYAEELLSDLDQLKGWPESVKIMQENWIGKRSGTEIDFTVVDEENEHCGTVTVFTTRPDTLFGITYLVLAVEHPLVTILIKEKPYASEINSYRTSISHKDNEERTNETSSKTGKPLHHFAIHPITKEKIPLWIGDYVLMDYGTGAVMAVPAHDQRDFEFAKTYSLPINTVIQPKDGSITPLSEAFIESGIMINSGTLNGMKSTDAKQEITKILELEGKGRKKTTYRLRDWLISRQRYWGTPIPMMYDEKNTPHPIDLDQLPVKLPKDVDFTGQGNPLESSTSFCKIKHNGKTYRRETDTMDTFFDSSWYYFRYCDSKNTTAPFAKETVNNWLPVDQYIGGIEHAVLHLLYARFFTKVLRDFGLTSVSEPFKNLLCQGMVLKDGAKMSKSLGNTVDPGHIINTYGADTARLFILFGAPIERDLEWSDEAVEGSYRFLKRIFKLVTTYKDNPISEKQRDSLDRETHKCIKKVTEDIERFSYNTAISRLMEFLNFMNQNGCHLDAIESLLKCLAPFAPFISEELWHFLGNEPSIHTQQWPTYKDELTVDETIEFVIQVNGKVRDKLSVDRNIEKEALEALALASERIQSFTAEKTIIKRIFIPKKLLNLVVK